MWRSWIAALGERAHPRERGAVVDAQHQALVVDDVRRDRARRRRAAASSTCGRYSSPWALSALSRGSASRSACAEKTKMPVLTSRISRSASRGVALALGLDDPLHGAVGVAHDAPVAARVLEHRASPSSRRRRRAAGPSTSSAIASALDERHVAAEDHDRRRPAGAPAPSSAAIAAPTAPPVPFGRSWTASSTPSGSTGSSARAGESTTTTRPAPAAQGGAHRPQHHREPAQLVQHLRRARAHARALAGGEDQDGRGAHGSEMLLSSRADAGAARARRAGGQGLEPRFSGPKPDVLPLDDPPRGHARIIVAPSAGARRRAAAGGSPAHAPVRASARSESSCILPWCSSRSRLSGLRRRAAVLARCRASRAPRSCAVPGGRARRARPRARARRCARTPPTCAAVDAATLCLVNRVRAAHHLRPLRANARTRAASPASQVRHDGRAGTTSPTCGPTRPDAAGAGRARPRYPAHAAAFAVGQNIAWGTGRVRDAANTSSPPGWPRRRTARSSSTARLPRRRRRRDARRCPASLARRPARRDLRDGVRRPPASAERRRIGRRPSRPSARAAGAPRARAPPAAPASEAGPPARGDAEHAHRLQARGSASRGRRSS